MLRLMFTVLRGHCVQNFMELFGASESHLPLVVLMHGHKTLVIKTTGQLVACYKYTANKTKCLYQYQCQ